MHGKIRNKQFNSSKKNDKLNDFDDNYEEPKKWYEEFDKEPTKFDPVTEQVLIDLKDEAKKCHDSEVANYNIKNSKSNNDYKWMKTVMSKGTVSDRIAAHTVAIQDNAICNLGTLCNLVNMVKVGKKKECITVIETLTELFVSDLLKPDAKLKPFHSRPISLLNELSSGNAVKRRKILSAWYFEDQLKEVYTSFVLALNTAAHDTVDSNKEKAISAMFKLLAGNPEQEKNLLAYIVNKLGDPSQKVASKAIYCLTQLLFKHLNMQEVVLNEIEKLLFRPNISSRAQYYSLCFLSQYYLSHEASNVARKLIELYFAFFKACIKKGDVDSRMMSALLMGINRAYPYAKLEFDKMSDHIDTMYRLVHLANFNISLQALTILYQVSVENMPDRFYSALYRKIVDPKLLTTTHQAMLLSLIYKALLKDAEVNRVKMFIKRLLQISFFVHPSFSCGILYLVSQLMGKKKDLQALVLKQTALDGFNDDDEEEKYQDVQDVEIKQEPAEDIEIKEEENEDKNKTEHDSKTMDTIEIKDEPEDDIKPDVTVIDKSLNGSTSWNFRDKKSHTKNKYNPLARNPLYGGGEYCAYTELLNLKQHFHPTVVLYANNILEGTIIKYSGDPLKDFTLIRFLDRFVFKNPRKFDIKTGAHPTFGKRKLYKPKGVKLLAVNSASYLKENEKNIPADELFMYSYLQTKYQDRRIKEQDDSDLESVQSEEFEEMLDKMAGLKDTEDDIDFMNEIGDNLKKKDKSKKDEEGASDSEELSEDEDGIEDFDDEDNFEDENDDFLDEDDKGLIDGLDDDSEEDIEFDDSDTEEITVKKPNKLRKKGKGSEMNSLFASADEFASLLEEEGSSKFKPGGSNAFANKDNANQKQLAWEDKRNYWLQGFKKSVGGKSKNFGKDKDFGKKRPNKSNKFGNKSKKMKN